MMEDINTKQELKIASEKYRRCSDYCKQLKYYQKRFIEKRDILLTRKATDVNFQKSNEDLDEIINCLSTVSKEIEETEVLLEKLKIEYFRTEAKDLFGEDVEVQLTRGGKNIIIQE